MSPNLRHTRFDNFFLGNALIAFVMSALVFGVGVSSPAAREATDETVEKTQGPQCLQAHLIREMVPVDRRTILFDMRSGTDYRVTLANDCYGIMQNYSINYDVRANRICTMDFFTVEDHGSCAYDSFIPVSQEEAKALRKQAGTYFERDKEEKQED